LKIILMMWIFGADRIWAELLRGAQTASVGGFFYYSAKYIAPLILAFVLGFWVWLKHYHTHTERFRSFSKASRGKARAGTRVGLRVCFLLALFIGMCVMVRVAFKRRQEEANGMSASGWVFMVLAWTFVIGLFRLLLLPNLVRREQSAIRVGYNLVGGADHPRLPVSGGERYGK
jgi:hypothetical protein